MAECSVSRGMILPPAAFQHRDRSPKPRDAAHRGHGDVGRIVGELLKTAHALGGEFFVVEEIEETALDLHSACGIIVVFRAIFVYLVAQRLFGRERGKPDHFEAVGMTVHCGEHLFSHRTGAAQHGDGSKFLFSHFISVIRGGCRRMSYAVYYRERHEQHDYPRHYAVEAVHYAAVSREYLAEVLDAERAFQTRGGEVSQLSRK